MCCTGRSKATILVIPAIRSREASDVLAQEKFLYWKSGQALVEAAQGSGGVAIPGGVQKMCRYSTSGHGLAGMVVLGWWLDLMILEVFSNLNNSMILWFYDSMLPLTS